MRNLVALKCAVVADYITILKYYSRIIQFEIISIIFVHYIIYYTKQAFKHALCSSNFDYTIGNYIIVNVFKFKFLELSN